MAGKKVAVAGIPQYLLPVFDEPRSDFNNLVLPNSSLLIAHPSEPLVQRRSMDESPEKSSNSRGAQEGWGSGMALTEPFLGCNGSAVDGLHASLSPSPCH